MALLRCIELIGDFMNSTKWTPQNGKLMFLGFVIGAIVMIVLGRTSGTPDASPTFQDNWATLLTGILTTAALFRFIFTLTRTNPNVLKRVVRLRYGETETAFSEMFKTSRFGYTWHQDEDNYHVFEFPRHDLHLTIHPYEPSFSTVGFPAMQTTSLLPYAHTLATIHNINAKNKAFAETLASAIDKLIEPMVVSKPTRNPVALDTPLVNNGRMQFLDNLRTLAIMLLVGMSIVTTYSPDGLWYYKEITEFGGVAEFVFTAFGALNQAFLVGLLFLISGYFVPESLARKGTRHYIRERIVRLGIPVLVYTLVIHPATMLLFHSFDQSLPTSVGAWYLSQIVSLQFLTTTGPLWIALTLLVFSVGYATVEAGRNRWLKQDSAATALTPTHLMVLDVVGYTTLAMLLWRLVFPIGIPFLNSVPGNFTQLSYFPLYVALFVVGAIAQKRGLLKNLSFDVGQFWMRTGLSLGFVLWICVTSLIGYFSAMPELVSTRGFHWESVAYTAWETSFAVSIVFGLVAFFRYRFNRQGGWSEFLSKNALGVLAFHPPVVVATTMALRDVSFGSPALKLILVAMMVLPLTFLISATLRQVPVIQRYFS